MKWYYKVVIGIIVAVFGYLLGNWIPLKPNIEKTVDYNLTVQIVSAVITFMAVIVALFKEDFRRLWDYSKLEVCFADTNGLSEKLEVEKNETNSETKSYKAEKYESILKVENIGKKTAKNCEIHLEKLIFKSDKDFNIEQSIPILNPMLKWNSDNDTKLHIPPKRKISVTVVVLSSPKEQSNPDGQVSSSKPILSIGGIHSPEHYCDGKWEAHFAVYSDDSHPVHFKLSLNWNGKWEQRFSEIKNCFTVNMIK